MADKDRAPLPPIKFEALADALLARAPTLVEQWLPGGKESNGEYLVHSAWRSEKTPSLSIKVSGTRAGHWADFGGDHRGTDLIQLYAAIHGIDNGQAAVQIARAEGLEDVAGIVMRAGGPPPPPRPPPPPAPAKPAKEEWSTIAPVPDGTPPTKFWHPIRERSQDRIEHTATYQVGDALYGYVVRFRTSDGGKETLPHTWCQSARDGTRKWHWKQWDEPRPLYFPSHSLPAGRTVIVVEGEKKADILQALLDDHAPGVYCVVSWPGGSKAWRKAIWTWLQGCTVLLWPDCDAKRELLTKAERDACLDDVALAAAQTMKPLLPAHKQTGMQAMAGIGVQLRDELGCSVQILPIPAPGEVVDGWDCADAITTDGWDFERVLGFFGQAQPFTADAPARPPAPAAGGAKPPPPAPPREGSAAAGDGYSRDDGEGDPLAEHFDFICEQLGIKRHELGMSRKLVIAALRKSKYLKDVLGYDELTDGPSTMRPWPWRTEAGPLDNNDDLRLGDWISTVYGVKPASRAALTEAIETVADANRFHPIRDYLEGLVWDGKPRLTKWLMHVFSIDGSKIPERKRVYLEMVSKYWLMGMVARVMTPGCKFDYSLVLEGKGGRGKSTFFGTLAGRQYFSDTHFDIGAGKDGFEQLEGLWLYELSELTALRKADSEQVKQFFSSQSDRYRGAYAKYVKAHHRQCVIGCSTNKKRYLYDLTGNRRFWPVWIGAVPIRIAWLARWRDQLFAEALHAFKAGERYFPTLDEEDEYFVPEQMKRMVETAVQSRLYTLLTREGAPGGEGKLTNGLNVNTTFVTLDELVIALGADAAKSSSMLESQVRGWLEAMDWEYKREGAGLRRYGYRQPKQWPPPVPDYEQDDDEKDPQTGQPPDAGGQPEGDDDLPF